MSNLPATLQGQTNEELAVALGLANPENTSLPVLRINYQKSREIDGEKIKLTKGIWTIFNGTEDVYGTDLKTTILLAGYQVREWDAAKEEYSAETIFFNTGWDKTPEDTAGGYRCGKVFNKDLEGMSDDEKAAQRNKKFYRVIWGVATLVGKNAQGKKAVAENIPFISRIRGQGFMPICEYLDSFEKSDPAFNYVTEWDIVEGEHETTDFWVPHPKRGAQTKGLAEPHIGETLRAILEWRDNFNKEVLREYDKKNGIVAAKLVDTAAAAEEVSAVVIDNDLDDEITF